MNKKDIIRIISVGLLFLLAVFYNNGLLSYIGTMLICAIIALTVYISTTPVAVKRVKHTPTEHTTKTAA